MARPSCKGSCSKLIMILTLSTSILLSTLVHLSLTSTGNFTIIPSSKVVAVEQRAVFRCRNPPAISIVWRVNNSAIGRTPPSYIVPGSTGGSDNLVDILTIMAWLEFNQTKVICEARFEDVTTQPETTPPVYLLIQGILGMGSNIRRSSSTITWEPPFSLDLNDVDPDIVYCMEMYNITCGVDDLLVSDCNVTEARYEDNRLQQGYIYRITITPRSNVQNARNGTNNTKEEMFTLLTNPRTSIAFVSESTMVSAVIHFENDGTIVDKVKSASYSLFLNSTDDIEDPPNNTSLATNFTHNTSIVTLNVNQPLPRRRLWNCLILALGCHEHPLTELFELSTHDFQNVTVISSSPGVISVIGDFISGSTAIGILAIVYSNDSNIHYQFIPRSEIPVITVSGLPGGQYKVSVFVVEKTGLPFNRSATTPRNLSLLEDDAVLSFFEHEVIPTSTGVCINCTFQDNSATGCVAVVHERISQLCSSGLMNIESSHKFNRSGDTAYGCIKGVSTTNYQIGVFNFMEIITTVPPSKVVSNQNALCTSQGRRPGLDVGQVVSIVIGVVLLVLIITMLIAVMVIACCKQIRLSLLSKIQAIRERCQQMKQKQSHDSVTMQPLTTDLSETQAHVVVNEDETYAHLQHGPAKPSQVQVKVVGIGSTAICGDLDKKPPKSNLIYTSIDPNPVSRVMVQDDLHKTVSQYSTLQQKEESSNEGEGVAVRRSRGDNTADQELAVGITYAFHSIQDPLVASELIRFTEGSKPGDVEGIHLVTEGKQLSLKLDKCRDTHGCQNREYLHPAMIIRSYDACNEWRHKDLVLPAASYRLNQLRLLRQTLPA